MLYQINKGSKSFGASSVFSDIQFEIKNTEKIAIVGRNGCGKSTLLKCIVSSESLDSGTIHKQSGATIGYLSQKTIEDENKTVREELNDAFKEIFILEKELKDLEEVMKDDHSDTILEKYAQLQTKFEDLNGYTYQSEINTVFTRFGFDQSDLDRQVKTFSGGQRTRIAFVKLLLSKPDILLLDEPTNQLDIPAKEALESALEKYDGTILFVSHDRMFLKKMATRVLEMGSISKVYDLNYEEYLEKKASNELVESVAKVEKEVKPQTVSFTDLKAIKNRVAKLEVLLEEAEQDLEAMRELRYEPEYYQDYRKMEELDAKIDDKHNEIAALMQEWEEKMAMLE